MTARPPRRAGQLAQLSTGLILQIHHTLTQLHTPSTADRKFSINTSQLLLVPKPCSLASFIHYQHFLHLIWTICFFTFIIHYQK